MKEKTKFLILIAFLSICSGLIVFKLTRAYLSDTEKVLGNSIQAGTWVTTPTSEAPTPTPTETLEPTGTPTMTPTLTPTPTITGHLVINEVYYDPDGAHMQGANPDENDFEWIEIYNPTSATVNLKNWKIVDNSGSERSISESNRDLLSGDFVILAKANNVRVIWGIPNDKFIAIGQNFGNGLANGGDSVILKDNLGNTIDQMSYGTDTTVLDPAAPDVNEGHSLERDPNGKDTDTASDFVDRTNPTPGS